MPSWRYGCSGPLDDGAGLRDAVFAVGDRWMINTIQYVGMGFYLLAAVLTITSGYAYFRRHGHVVLE